MESLLSSEDLGKLIDPCSIVGGWEHGIFQCSEVMTATFHLCTPFLLSPELGNCLGKEQIIFLHPSISRWFQSLGYLESAVEEGRMFCLYSLVQDPISIDTD